MLQPEVKHRINRLLGKRDTQNSFKELFKDGLSGITPKLEDEFIEALIVSDDITSDEISFRSNDNSQKAIENPIKTSKEDSILRAKVDEEDKYNIISDGEEQPLFVLFTPAKGIVSEKFNIDKKHFAVDIALKENMPIKSAAEGTVIFSEWTAETGYVIIIEHPNDLLSVYKHNASLLKQQGERVEAGEVVASAGNTGQFSTGFHLHFELGTE